MLLSKMWRSKAQRDSLQTQSLRASQPARHQRHLHQQAARSPTSAKMSRPARASKSRPSNLPGQHLGCAHLMQLFVSL